MRVANRLKNCILAIEQFVYAAIPAEEYEDHAKLLFALRKDTDLIRMKLEDWVRGASTLRLLVRSELSEKWAQNFKKICISCRLEIQENTSRRLSTDPKAKELAEALHFFEWLSIQKLFAKLWKVMPANKAKKQEVGASAILKTFGYSALISQSQLLLTKSDQMETQSQLSFKLLFSTKDNKHIVRPLNPNYLVFHDAPFLNRPYWILDLEGFEKYRPVTNDEHEAAQLHSRQLLPPHQATTVVFEYKDTTGPDGILGLAILKNEMSRTWQISYCPVASVFQESRVLTKDWINFDLTDITDKYHIRDGTMNRMSAKVSNSRSTGYWAALMLREEHLRDRRPYLFLGMCTLPQDNTSPIIVATHQLFKTPLSEGFAADLTWFETGPHMFSLCSQRYEVLTLLVHVFRNNRVMAVGKKRQHFPGSFYLKEKLDEIVPLMQYETILAFLGRKRVYRGTDLPPIERFYRLQFDY